MFNCVSCKKTYAQLAGLSRHKRSCGKATIKIHECLNCHKIFNRKDVMKKHSIVCQNKIEVKEFVCHNCKKIFPSKWRLERHIPTHINGSSEKITEETIIGGENVLPNAIVVRGNWFIESKKGSRMYRLDSKKEVVISSNSVRFILPSLEIVKEGRKVLFSISEEQHEDIIESLL